MNTFQIKCWHCTMLPHWWQPHFIVSFFKKYFLALPPSSAMPSLSLGVGADPGAELSVDSLSRAGALFLPSFPWLPLKPSSQPFNPWNAINWLLFILTMVSSCHPASEPPLSIPIIIHFVPRNSIDLNINLHLKAWSSKIKKTLSCGMFQIPLVHKDHAPLLHHDILGISTGPGYVMNWGISE